MDAQRRRRVSGGLAAVLLLAAGAACSDAQGVDKAGGDTAVLMLASIDEVNNNGQSFGTQAFVENLAAVSGGRLKVEVTTEFGAGAPDAEAKVVKAIATGEVDGGWPATRAFAAAGLPGLEAVEAPMTITSYAAQKELVSGPVAEKLLSQLDSTGVVGLGLAVGPLRRPFAAKAPLVGPADWNGVKFRSYNSPVQQAAVRALGGTPVNVTHGWVDAIRDGQLRGAEFDIPQYAKNGESTVAGNVTANVVLWPKVYVLSMSRQRFDALTEQQRGWVREAAERATRASVDATYEESAIATQLCAKGVRFAMAAPDQLAALRTKFRPVIDRLSADPKSGPLLKEIQAIAAADAEPDVPTVPIACQQEQEKKQLGEIPTTTSAIPDGIYRVELTVADLEAAGANNDLGLSGTWTLRIRQGGYQLSCKPLSSPGVDCGHTVYDGPLDAGDVRGAGNTVYFVYRPDRLAQLTGCQLPMSSTISGRCAFGESYRMSWAFDGKQLVLSDFVGSWLNPQYLIEPWQKIG
jgi:TRAP-type C4-dicarboxylate transport system substrate-binding protein